MVPCKHKPIQPSLPVLSERVQRFYPYPVPKAEFDADEQSETAQRQAQEEAKNYNENVPLR